MPGAVIRVAVGLFGKLPARGDFVRSGLPRDFMDAWDAWLSDVMSVTREQAGEAWLAAFLQAPVWRFTLSAGLCGAGAVIGLMLPSVDRAGRYFPLILAAVVKAGGVEVDAAAEAWLDRCEVAGLAALEKDAGPEEIRAMPGCAALVTIERSNGQSEWWTDGSPLVPAGRMTFRGLPDAMAYAAMLGTVAEAEQLVNARKPIIPLK